jgi:predicted regulator of Ras-like GTPase activity (Roadblock/LC7/MglB family)
MISPVFDIDNSSENLSLLITSIDEEMAYLAEFSDVQAVILFRLDGKVLKSQNRKKDSQNLLIVISWVKNIISKTMEELQKGSRSVKYDKEISEKEAIPVYFFCAGKTSIVVAILTSVANTGLMEIEMSRSSRRIGWIIDQKKAIR